MHSKLKIMSDVVATALTRELNPNPFKRKKDGTMVFEYDEIVVRDYAVVFKHRGTEIAELPTEFDCRGSTLNITQISGEVDVTIEQC